MKVRHVGTPQQRVERKILIATADVTAGAVSGIAETWSKSVLRVDSIPEGIEVTKVRWRRGPVELVDLDGGRWWSVALRLDNGIDLRQVFAAAPFAWRLTRQLSMSYPAALLATRDLARWPTAGEDARDEAVGAG